MRRGNIRYSPLRILFTNPPTFLDPAINKMQPDIEILKSRHASYLANRNEILKSRREYYLKNRDKILERQREYNKNGIPFCNNNRIVFWAFEEKAKREKINAQQREWRKNNRDKVNEYARRWREKNKEKVYQEQLNYRRSHPEKVRQWNENYRKKKNIV